MLSVWRDLLISGAIAAVGAVIAARVDLHERLFAYSRRWESMQLDELPVGIFIFAVCLVGFYARRVRELQRVLRDNRQLAQRTLDVQEAERKHLARELHDELGQYVNAIKLDSLSLTGMGQGEMVSTAADRITRNADHVYGVVGSMIHRLRPAGLDELGLVAALEACVDQWRALQPGPAIRLSTSGDLDSLGERMSLAIYRIVQEGLTNSVRHASASQVEVMLVRNPAASGRDMVALTVRDDGSVPASRR